MSVPCAMCGRPEHRHHCDGRVSEPPADTRAKRRKGSERKVEHVEQRICGTCVQQCRSMEGLTTFPGDGLGSIVKDRKSAGWTGQVKEGRISRTE